MNNISKNRLFKAHCDEPYLTDKIIKALVQEIIPERATTKDLNKKKSPEQMFNGPIKAGYTYLGQFISHDIVPSTGKEAVKQRRTVTPQLNLDSLYGDKSCGSMLFEQSGKFLLAPIDRRHDLRRDEHQQAIIPEPRNDENALVAQFHLFWQEVHNHFIDIGYRFVEAKKITISLFHSIVINDYLKQILDTKVHKEYFTHYREHIILATDHFKRVPLEFSHAVFRFGHSMVRQNYCLRKKNGTTTSLEELVRGCNGGNIKGEHKVCWHHFFSKEHSNPIDISIASSMGALPQMEKHIVKLNLIANNTAELPSGFQVYGYIKKDYKTLFCITGLNTQQPEYTPGPSESELKKLYDNETLPLWLYTLEEAKSNIPTGRQLGKLGSIVIAETLRKSIQSYYSTSKFEHIPSRIENELLGTTKQIAAIPSEITMLSLIHYITSYKETIMQNRWLVQKAWVNQIPVKVDLDLEDYFPKKATENQTNQSYLMNLISAKTKDKFIIEVINDGSGAWWDNKAQKLLSKIELEEKTPQQLTSNGMHSLKSILGTNLGKWGYVSITVDLEEKVDPNTGKPYREYTTTADWKESTPAAEDEKEIAVVQASYKWRD